MDDLTEDNENIENLLKALSTNEAVKLFSDIDKKIIQLLNCSTEDFFSLNNHFKNYHKESKNIAVNASNIIQIITDSTINNSFNNLKKFGEHFTNLTEIFSKHIEFIDIEIKKTINKFEELKIAHNNYRQNFTSLKLLLANLNIDKLKEKSNDFSKTINNEIEGITETIKTLISETDLLIEQFIHSASESNLLLKNIKKENYNHIQKLNDNIEISFALFNKKYNEASAMYPSLKDMTDKSATNISVIITNLQYHDIIMQKIKHIQRTHKEIISELQQYNDDENDQTVLHNKAKIFLKIRDIAGLQAAQLIHANKQYQVAITEISQNLEEIGNEMIVINSLCENLVGKSSNTQKYYLNNIIENLNITLNYNNILSNFITNIKQHTQNLVNKNNEFSNLYSKIHIQKKSIKELVEKISREAIALNINNENQSISGLKQLIIETDQTELYINKIITELKQKIEIIVNPEENFLIETNILHNLNDLSTTIPGLIDLLKESIRKIDEFLYITRTISLNISNHIKNSLKKIKYYDLFENVSNKIIEDLNSINLKLSYGNFAKNMNKEDNLKHLKERYTMASEHIIHEHISKTADQKNLSNAEKERTIIELTDQNSKTDDDNLELF